jgi:C4-dicarboxylate transporter DctM subunit
VIFSLLLFLALILLVVFGFPVAFAIGIPSVILNRILEVPMVTVITKMFGGINSFSLMAIPFFILAGKIMEEAGITEKIVDFANSLVGHLRGGMGHVNILSSMILAGIQGSGVADASAIGAMVIPAMVKQGYHKDFSVAVTATSATIGPIIPPSIAIILYAFYTNQSVGALFLGSTIPGILIGVGLMVMCYVVSIKRGYRFMHQRSSLSMIMRTFFSSSGALIMPFIIVGGIVTGIFTATEAGVIAVVYGFLFGIFVTRRLKLNRLRAILVDASVLTAVVMIIISFSTVFGNLLSRLGFQSHLIAGMEALQSKLLISLAIMIALLIFGLFIDTVVLLVMFSATLSVIGNNLGFHPIQFGVWVVMVMLVGAVTPPVGTMLFVSCVIADAQVDEVLLVLLPFLLVLLVVILLVLFFPALTLWVPTFFGMS